MNSQQTEKVIRSQRLQSALMMASLQGYVPMTQRLPEVAMYKEILAIAEQEGFSDAFSIGPSRNPTSSPVASVVSSLPLGTVQRTVEFALAYLNSEVLPKGFTLQHAGSFLLLLAPPQTQTLQ